ncbi:MAG: hypothetical protein EPO20_13065 [Betaproteobacteria bacterium]|nr:MAG: hypothetical protein EPO20_13065 [Betaproteobacteria bacterium]
MFRDRLQQEQHQRARQIEERMATLFQRLPMLSGFSVHSEFDRAEVWLDTWPGWDPSDEVAEEVLRVLQEIVAERPENAELLRGRTFARSLN